MAVSVCLGDWSDFGFGLASGWLAGWGRSAFFDRRKRRAERKAAV